MSQPDPFNELDLFRLCKQLLQAGWDAYASDLTGEVAARQDNLPNRGAWSLAIDRSGRWRFTATCAICAADGRELIRGDQTWRLLKEKQQVLTVAGRLSSQDELADLLAELTQLAQQETALLSPEAEGKPTWDKNHERRAKLKDL